MNVLSYDYHSIVISDHAPTSLDINFPNHNCSFKPWRFNSNLLATDLLVDSLKSNIELFFEMNDKPEVSRGTLWESFEAYLRGHIISYTAHPTRKIAMSRQTELAQKILEIDDSYANNPDPSLYKKHLQCQTEFNLLTSDDAEMQLLKSRQRIFESGDKAGKFLAQQARAAAASRFIPSIKSSSGTTTDPKLINETSSKFYSDLSASSHPNTSSASVLSTIEFPKVVQELVGNLAKPQSPQLRS